MNLRVTILVSLGVFVFGAIAGMFGVMGIPTEPRTPTGVWGLVRTVDGEPLDRARVVFRDGSREGVQEVGYSSTDAAGRYPRDRSVPKDARFRSVIHAGYDFGAIVGERGRVDFVGIPRRHGIVVKPSTGPSPDQGVTVSPFGEDRPEWFGPTRRVRVASGTHEVTVHEMNGAVGSTVVVSFGDTGEPEVPITVLPTSKLQVTVALAPGELSDGVDLFALRFGGTDSEPPAANVLRLGATEIPRRSKADGSEQAGRLEFERVLPSGRYLIGASRAPDRIEVSRVIDLTGDRTATELVLPAASETRAVPYRFEDTAGRPLHDVTVGYRARWGGGQLGERILEGVAPFTRAIDDRAWVHLPIAVLDLWEGVRSGAVELRITSPGRVETTLSPTAPTDLVASGLGLRIPAEATVELNLEMKQPTTAPLHATLTLLSRTDEGSETFGVPEVARIIDGRARFEVAMEGEHRVAIYASRSSDSVEGLWLHQADVTLEPGANPVRIELPAWRRLELETPDVEEGAVVTLEPLRREPVADDVAPERDTGPQRRVVFEPMPLGDYLVHLFRANGKHLTTQMIVIDEAAAPQRRVIRSRRPNALLVVAPDGIPGGEFRFGDVITAIEGEPIRSDRLRVLLLGLEEGGVPVTVRRGDEDLALELDFEAYAESGAEQGGLRPIFRENR